jgi:hypothetical protein
VTSVVLALWLAHFTPDVTGDSPCPTPAEVREQLVTLAPVSDGDSTGKPGENRANVSSTGSNVHVELLSLDGQSVGERTLERSGSCSDMAEAVAVIIWTWEAKFDPNLATPTVHPPKVSPSDSAPTVAQEVKSKPSRPMSFDAGFALLASMAGGEAAFGTKLEGCLFPGAGSLGLDLALSATSTHSQSTALSVGTAEWLRAALSVVPTYRLRWSAARLDLHVGPALALLHVRGSGLAATASDTCGQLGVVAGVRGLWVWNNAAGWISADIYTYPGQDRLTIGNYGEVGQLPHLDVQLSFGMSLGQFR